MFAIVGATGKVGGATAEVLRKAGQPVRAIVRDASKAEALAALGCEVAVADARDTEALARAFAGASAVQVICPVAPRADDAAGEMRGMIEAIGEALEIARPARVLAISDYGAELSEPTGITGLFHDLEKRLARASRPTLFLRSAEHMQNWSRVLGAAARTGRLPSLHHPLTKLFPMVSAFDVGAVAAELLLAPSEASPRVVNVEGPRRYSPMDVAAAVAELDGREVQAFELPRSEWSAMLAKGGVSESYARLVVELYEVHNAGRIDAERGGAIRRGPTEFAEALRRARGQSRS